MSEPIHEVVKLGSTKVGGGSESGKQTFTSYLLEMALADVLQENTPLNDILIDKLNEESHNGYTLDFQTLFCIKIYL